MVKYNEDLEIWETLLNKTRKHEFNFTADILLNNGQQVSLSLSAIHIDDTPREGVTFFGGTSKNNF